jgi:pyruvate/2-oxoglutarate dehydrogenase complex dihydrolipoamide dehydrogenase (E3) component
MSAQPAYDVIVIGGGPAGVTAALRACELGARTALVERNLLGGTCTNDGCVPTRVLAKAARLHRETELFSLYGLEAPRPTINFAELLERAQQVVYQLQEKKQTLSFLQAVGCDVYENVGAAQFTSDRQIRLPDGRTLDGDRFVICAGGQARRLPVPGGDMALVHSDLWTLQELPASVAIIGAGATGAQLATIFWTFGVRVTLADFAPRILPTEDVAISERMEAIFRADGIDVVTGARTEALERQPNGSIDVIMSTNDEKLRLQVERVISAVGWPGNLEALGLEAAGIEPRGAYVWVNDFLQTSVPHIYAAGDITGKIMLVQTASLQARAAVENALTSGPLRAYSEQLVPHGGFTDPEYAAVGMTEEQAIQQSGQGAVIVEQVEMSEVDRAVIDGRLDGFCKLVVRRADGEVIGAHIVGETAVETINVVAAGMLDGLQVEKLARLDFAYPTFCSVISLAARQIARELRLLPVAERWHELGELKIAEWERRAT